MHVSAMVAVTTTTLTSSMGCVVGAAVGAAVATDCVVTTEACVVAFGGFGTLRREMSRVSVSASVSVSAVGGPKVSPCV